MSRFNDPKTSTRRKLRAMKRLEAEERNAAAKARPRRCGHVHGEGVGCMGRES